MRSGKTWTDILAVIPFRVFAAPDDGEIVLLGYTPETLTRNVLRPMRRIWGNTLVGPIQTNGTLRLFGRQATVLGAEGRDRARALQGMSIAYCYGDEVTTWHPDVFDMLKGRMDRAGSRFDGTCNPAGPGHWFKRFLDTTPNVYQQTFLLEDNPYLPPAFVRSLKTEYAGTVLYDRYILGRWAQVEDAVYRGFDERMHVVDKARNIGKITFGVDVGHVNATAFLAVGEGEDGRRYVLDEYYHSGREAGARSPLGYAKDFVAFRDGVLARYDAADAGVYVDPSAAGFVAQLKEVGVFRVYRARNAVVPGIARVASLLEAGGLRVLAGCRHTLREFGGYRWDEAAAAKGVERPVKTDDHCMDALRYVIASTR